ncbi:hypothetical protein K0M31_015643 [Melipona bicolor]|uniref:Uncharacterized protein n=1 Tax=Melipona bicolor TaxID=60889 RepID=A0AA40FEU6_9HYME|nr:hypothetical protein K0M31_015643 [Melipona bicolor]
MSGKLKSRGGLVQENSAGDTDIDTANDINFSRRSILSESGRVQQLKKCNVLMAVGCYVPETSERTPVLPNLGVTYDRTITTLLTKRY